MTTRDEQIRKLFLRSAIAARDAARNERDALRDELATLRLVAQAALTRGLVEEYEQALEDIASETLYEVDIASAAETRAQ